MTNPRCWGICAPCWKVDSHRVETDRNGSAAMERLQRDPVPDVVLLDLVMPELDGLDDLEQMRRMRPGLK